MEEPILPESLSPQPQPAYIKVLLILAKLIGYAISVLVITLLFCGMLILFVPNLSAADLQENNLSQWQPITIIYVGILAGTFLVTWLFRVHIDKQPFDTIGLQFKNVGAKLLKGAMYSIGILSISFLIMYLLGVISIVDMQFEITELLGFLLLFFIAALVEELIFRGYMISLIAKDFHFMAALLLSSLAFAAVHIGNDNFTWIGFWNIFLGGYLMGLIFLKYNDLYMPLGLHWIWNFFQGNILGFGVSGNEVSSLLSIKMNGADWLTGSEFGMEGSIISTVLLLVLVIWLTYDKFSSFQVDKFSS